MPVLESNGPEMQQRLVVRNHPGVKPAMHQCWKHLLFLHWAWDPESLQVRLPPGLTIDTWDGHAWLGVVPFYMHNIRPVWSPSIPWVSNFLELNLRTYVYDEAGRPGVWFFSLDANRSLAVWAARRFFSLPYQHARMTATQRQGRVFHRSIWPETCPRHCTAAHEGLAGS